MIYRDFNGEVTTEQWFAEHFGQFSVVTNEDAQYHVIELRAVFGYPHFRLQVLNENGAPVPDVALDFQNGGSSIVYTKPDGWAECPMYRGSWYNLPGPGPHHIEFRNKPSERVGGIGLVIGAPRDYTHFDVVTQAGQVEPPPPPPPPPPDEQVIAELQQALAKNAEVAVHIQNALDLLT